MNQFQMTDAPDRPQRVAIRWEMKTPRDEYAGAPDKMQDGFWPSLDSSDPGYIGEGATAKDLKRAKAKAQLRYNRWIGDAWQYVGVVAVAHVFIPVGGQSFRVLTLESAGLWGIESDSGKYLREVYEEQKAELMAQLVTLGDAMTGAAPWDEEDSK